MDRAPAAPDSQTLEREEQQRDDWRAEARGHESDADAPRPPNDSQHARAMADAMQQARSRHPATGWSRRPGMHWWTGRRDCVRSTCAPTLPGRAPSSRRRQRWMKRSRVCARANVFEPTTTIASIPRHARRGTRGAPTRRKAKPGSGCWSGHLDRPLGAAFDRVYVLGMAEGLLPSRPAADPLAMGSDADSRPTATARAPAPDRTPRAARQPGQRRRWASGIELRALRRRRSGEPSLALVARAGGPTRRRGLGVRLRIVRLVWPGPTVAGASCLRLRRAAALSPFPPIWPTGACAA